MNYSKLPRLLSAFHINKKTFKLARESLNHLRALRVSSKSNLFRVFNGKEGEYLASVRNLDSGECTLEQKLREQPPKKRKQVWLFSTPIDRTRNSILIEKAVELDVSFLFPQVITERTQQQRIREGDEKIIVNENVLNDLFQSITLDETLLKFKSSQTSFNYRSKPPLSVISAWVKDAAEQCERLSLPILSSNPITLEQAFDFWMNESVSTKNLFGEQERLLLICDEGFARSSYENDHTIKDLSIIEAISKLPKDADIGVLIGPEGGFTKNEKNLFKKMEIESNYIKRITLGENILRAETAAIVALSQISLALR